MMVIDNKYAIGDMVFLKTDIEQHQRIVTRIMISANSAVLYELFCGKEQGWHYDIEIATEKNILVKE